MRFLAISGSTRAASTNTALLRAVREIAPAGIAVDLYEGIGALPVFSPDSESDPPAAVCDFVARIAEADGLIISSPEYIHAIPGGLKNAIDWLVAGEAVIAKPVALMHASHRGEDMLASLRLVLGTVTTRFAEDIFLRVPVMSLTPEAVERVVTSPANRAEILDFLDRFAAWCGRGD